MRLIDADNIMGRFVEKAYKINDRHGVKLSENWLLDYDEIKDVIDNAPTVEQPTGEWIPVNPIQMDLLGGYKCSVCGWGDYSIQIGVDKYCKFCGAKMKEGEKE